MGTTYYLYDTGGQLLGEYDASGQPIKEYVHLEGEPIAQMENTAITYLHTDHLATPRKATNEAGQAVWQWESEAFGNALPQSSGIAVNLRFPGQYYDEETGLYYNYFRYYDPEVGRYITSDPIGLGGGLNTYIYANANPISFYDSLGLWAEIRCIRCGGSGAMNCSIFEDGTRTGSFETNKWKNDTSITPGDPYGTNGPLPPGTYNMPNAYSPKFERKLPSPTNTGIP
ncbi:MAG: hypothetical protein GY814_09595, partial [Gammaproteobacteria bacterium]|nr:hypothetical protein [Gammaproteobacteria bacterium]